MSHADRALMRLAAEHHGLITMRQARSHGLSTGQVRERLASGRWQRLGRGVYRIAGAPETHLQRALAACLTRPDGSLGSHLTAAWVQDTWSAPPDKPHITVAVGRSNRSSDAIVHRTRRGPLEAVWIKGVPVTSPARTLVDCAAILGPNQLQRVVNAAFYQRLVTVRSVERAWNQARLGPGRQGERRLRAAIEPWTGAIRPDSPAEVRLRQLVVQWGFPEPEVQVPIRDAAGETIARVDLGWSGPKIGLEYDGEEFHGPARWAADQERQRLITALGWKLHRADKADLRPGERSLQRALARSWEQRSAA